MNAATLDWVGNFETGDTSQYKDHLYDPGTYSRKTLVTSPVRAGKYAVLLEILGKERPVKERAELITTGSPTGGVMQFQWNGPEYWVGFSFRLKDWNSTAWTFFQIHAPDETNYPDLSCKVGANAITIRPTGAATNNGVDNRIALGVIEDGTKIPGGPCALCGQKTVWTDPLKSGVWYDFVVRMKLSTEGKGYIEVWRNGEKIYSKFNMTNVQKYDRCGNLQTDAIKPDKQHDFGANIGVYSDNAPLYRGIYYDEVRIATGTDGYNLVAPPGSPPPDSPPASGGGTTTATVAPPLPPQNLQ